MTTTIQTDQTRATTGEIQTALTTFGRHPATGGRHVTGIPEVLSLLRGLSATQDAHAEWLADLEARLDDLAANNIPDAPAPPAADPPQ